MDSTPDNALVIELKPVENVVIWMHGLGASGHDIEPIVPLLGVDRTRFIFPHAPIQPVTLNMGMSMPSWYDIVTLSGPSRENLDDARRSAARIEQIISTELERGIPADRITLAGFSQGGAMALHVGLRYPVTLAGIMGLPAYLLDVEGTPNAVSAANRETPVFFAHGRNAAVVPYSGGQASFEAVRSLNASRPMVWKEYAMGHVVCPQEISDIGTWLRARHA